MDRGRRGFLARLGAALAGVLGVSAEAAGGQAPQRAVPLLECHVAGTTYAQLPADFEEQLGEGDPLLLRREPDNPADHRAVLVLDASGRKLGYLPRDQNEVISRLLDGDVGVAGEIIGWRREGRWLRIDIRVAAFLPAPHRS